MSGAQIKIANPVDGSTDRLVTITGTPASISLAEYLMNARWDTTFCMQRLYTYAHKHISPHSFIRSPQNLDISTVLSNVSDQLNLDKILLKVFIVYCF